MKRAIVLLLVCFVFVPEAFAQTDGLSEGRNLDSVGPLNIRFAQEPLEAFAGEMITLNLTEELPAEPTEARIATAYSLYRMLKAIGDNGDVPVREIAINPAGLNTIPGGTPLTVHDAAASLMTALSLYGFESTGEGGIRNVTVAFGDLIPGETRQNSSIMHQFADAFGNMLPSDVMFEMGADSGNYNQPFCDYMIRVASVYGAMGAIEVSISMFLLSKGLDFSKSSVIAKLMAVELAGYLGKLSLESVNAVMESPKSLEPVAILGFLAYLEMSGQRGEAENSWNNPAFADFKEKFLQAANDGALIFRMNADSRINSLDLGSGAKIFDLMAQDPRASLAQERLGELLEKKPDRDVREKDFRFGQKMMQMSSNARAKVLSAVGMAAKR